MAADIETIVAEWLADQLGARVRQVLTGETPANLLSNLPIGVVTLTGGFDEQRVLSRPRVDVDWYTAGRDAGVALAGRAHDLLRYVLANHRTAGGHVITAVRTGRLPIRLPYDSRNQVWKYGGSYELWLQQRAHTP